MYGGSIQYTAPMIFALGFIGLFTIGGLTGVLLANAALDVAFHDTLFLMTSLPAEGLNKPHYENKKSCNTDNYLTPKDEYIKMF
jgi:hypothetical protein